MRIVLDAGHGGYDAGASSYGRKEKDDALRLTLAVGELLKDKGYDVVYTREDDVYNSPFEKATKANNYNGDLFVSIHRNSSESPNQYSGVETLVFNNSGIKSELANNINKELEEVGFKNLGVKERPRLVVLRRTKMPAVLVEAGFINNEEDNRLFDDNFEMIAEAIADGIDKTYSKRSMAKADFLESVDTLEKVYTIQIGDKYSIDSAAKLERELRSLGYSTIMIDA